MRRFGVCLLAMFLMVGVSIIQGTGNSRTAGADEYEEAGGGQHWTINAESRVGEGQESIPFEFYYGQPMGAVELNSTPLACEAWGAQYYAGVVAEEGALATTGLYYNRTLARSHLPEDQSKGIGGAPPRKQKAEVGPGTKDAGPYALAECADKRHGHGFARFNGGGPIAGGQAEVNTVVDQASSTAKTVAHSQVFGVEIPGGLSIKFIDSVLEVNQKPSDGDIPEFSYKLTLAGVSAGGTEIFGFGDKALTIAGTNQGGDFLKQFNEQAKAHREDMKAIQYYDFKIVAPKAYKDEQYDRWNINGAVIEGGIGFPSRKGTVGEYQAMRLGSNWYHGAYTQVKEGDVTISPIEVCKTC